MGTTLLIGSCEPFSGKSALVLGIAQKLTQEGQKVRFGKPLATSLDWDPNKGPLPQPLIDDDVRFVSETLGLAADRLIPSLHLRVSSGVNFNSVANTGRTSRWSL